MILLFTITLAISFVIVQIGSIAFQLTGLEWSLSKFQALSCFTGTGFTTKEAELITGSPQRRKIASVLMVLGKTGLVTLILTGADYLITEKDVVSTLSRLYLPSWIGPQLATYVNIIILAAAVILVYKIFTNKKITLKLTDFLREKIIKKEFFSRVSIEELLLATGGYGVSRVKVYGESPVLNKTLIEADLRKQDITVLAIVRGKETIANPGAERRILRGDELVCFGKLENMRSHLSSPPAHAKSEKVEPEPEKTDKK